MADRMNQVDKNRSRARRAKRNSRTPKKRSSTKRQVFDQKSAPMEQHHGVRSDGMQQIILPMGGVLPEQHAVPEEKIRLRRKSRKEQRRIRTRRRMLFALALLLLIAAGVILSGNVLFKVDSYKITDAEGNESTETGIYSQDAILAALNVHIGDNMYGFDAAEKAAAMEQTLPYLENIRIHRRLPGTVVIQVQTATPTYCMQGNYGWAELSSQLKVLSIQQDTFENLIEIKMPVDTPVVGLHLQIEETQADRSEASAVSETTESKAVQETRDKLNSEMKQTFAELISLLEKESLLDGVNCIDMQNIQEITVQYQNRLTIKLGTENSLPYKMQLTGVIVRNDDGNCLSDSDRGTLDVSHIKKDDTIEPVFRSENDIDITAAIGGGTEEENETGEPDTSAEQPDTGDDTGDEEAANTNDANPEDGDTTEDGTEAPME